MTTDNKSKVMMDVSVIMINYNTYEFTCAALDSIFDQTSGINFEIILIDNNSPDMSGDRLAEKYGKKISYIQAGDNLGTSKAFNLGLQQAKGKYILWLNTDILIRENFIYKLYNFMENNPQCGICGGNILDFNGNPAHSYLKKIFSPETVRKDTSFTVKLFRKVFKKLLSLEYNYSNKVMRVGYITGADMMIRRELIEKIGPFDEDIFMYAEEVEFTYRTHKLTDYTVCNVPDAHIYHLEGASFNGEKKVFNIKRYKLNLNGNCVYIKKHFGKNGVERYLKTLKRAYTKYILVCTLLFMKGKKSEFKEKRAVVSELLKVQNY